MSICAKFGACITIWKIPLLFVTYLLHYAWTPATWSTTTGNKPVPGGGERRGSVVVSTSAGMLVGGSIPGPVMFLY